MSYVILCVIKTSINVNNFEVKLYTISSYRKSLIMKWNQLFDISEHHFVTIYMINYLKCNAKL